MTVTVSSSTTTSATEIEHERATATNGDGSNGSVGDSWASAVDAAKQPGNGNSGGNGNAASGKDAENAKAVEQVTKDLSGDASRSDLESAARTALETVKKNGGDQRVETALGYILNPQLKASGDYNPTLALTNLTAAANAAGFNGKDAQSGQAVDDFCAKLKDGVTRSDLEQGVKTVQDVLTKNGGGETTAKALTAMLDPRLQQNGEFDPKAAAEALSNDADIDGLHGKKAQTDRAVTNAFQMVAREATSQELKDSLGTAKKYIDANGGCDNSKKIVQDLLDQIGKGTYDPAAAKAFLREAGEKDGLKLPEDSDPKATEKQQTAIDDKAKNFDAAVDKLLAGDNAPKPAEKDSEGYDILYTTEGDPGSVIKDTRQQYKDAGYSDTESKDLSRPTEAAALLTANWDKWNLSKCDFSNPSAMKGWDKLSDEAKDIIHYVGDNPSLLKAMGGAKDKGTISKDSVQKFASDAQIDQKSALDSLADYKKSNPNADEGSLCMAKSAAALAANHAVLTDSDGKITAKSLAAASSSGLSPDLMGASKTFSDPGMFKMIDSLGEPSTTSSDGVIEASDINTWLKCAGTPIGAPNSASSLNTMLNRAATYDALGGSDDAVKKAAPDAVMKQYINGNMSDDDVTKALKAAGSDASVDTFKAAAYYRVNEMEMSTAQMPTNAWDQEKAKAVGINPNWEKDSSALNEAYTKLAASQPTSGDFVKACDKAKTGIVNGDPALKTAVTNYLKGDVASGKALAFQLSGDNPDYTKVTSEFMQSTSGLSKATGGTGSVDVADMVNKQPDLKKKITSDYDSKFKSAQSLDEALKKPDANPTKAYNDFVNNATSMGLLLGTSADEQNSVLQKANDVMAKYGADNLTSDQVKLAFGKDGDPSSLDESKVKKYYQDLIKKDPSMFEGLTDESGNKLDPKSASDTDKLANIAVNNMKKAFPDLLRQGGKLVDKSNFGDKDGFERYTYSTGWAHVMSGALGTVGLGFKIASMSGNPITSTQSAQMAMEGIGLLATMTDGVSKIVKNAANAEGNKDSTILKAASESLEDVNKYAKIFGGVAGVVGSSLTIAQNISDLNSSDDMKKATAIVNIAGASASAVSGFAGAMESISTMTTFFGASGTWAAVAGGFGAIGAGIGVIGGMLSLGSMANSHQKVVDKWFNSDMKTLSSWGITGGPTQDGDYVYDIPPEV